MTITYVKSSQDSIWEVATALPHEAGFTVEDLLQEHPSAMDMLKQAANEMNVEWGEFLTYGVLSCAEYTVH